ncbi:MAG: hypothetical protein N4A33_09265 [Bacteriovoracaceae bacterium]|jgi:Flp pilus assembly protein TadD|nr:hypothetical protein [Bacteriovoracaceae bacterium]
MVKYRAKINGRIVGPLSKSDIQNLIKNNKIKLGDDIQKFPDGDWKSLSSFPEFDSGAVEDKTFIKNIFDFKEDLELTDQKKLDFPKEYKFEKDQDILNKTKVIRVKNDDDKTKITPETLKYLEQLKKDKEEQEKKALKEESEKKEVEEKKIDLKNDATQFISLDDLKKDVSDEAVQNELQFAREIEEKNKNQNEIELTHTQDDSEYTTETTNKKKKLLIPVVILILLLFLFDDDKDKQNTQKKITVQAPKILFPRQFDTINELKAKEFYEKGLKILEKDTYINRVKAAIAFRVSTEHKFKSNPAMPALIKTYSQILEDSNTKTEDGTKIFKLIQIFRDKAITSSKYAEAISTFYQNMDKPYAAIKTIEKFNSITSNKPTVDLFAIYLKNLALIGDIAKANKVLSKLENVKSKSLDTAIAMIEFYNYIGENEKATILLNKQLKIKPYSVNLLLKKAKIELEKTNIDLFGKILDAIKKRSAEKSKIYYAKYLEFRGLQKVFEKDNKKATKYFKKSLLFNESSELRSKLANLELSQDPIANRLIEESKAIKLINKSKLNYKKGNKTIAFKLALDATNITENYIPAIVNLAKLQIDSGLFREAIDSLENLQRKNISDPDVTFTLIEAYLESYKLNDVKKLLSIISTSNLVEDYRYFSMTAMYYVYKEDFYNSVAWLQQAIKKNPLNEKMLFELSKILLEYRKYNKTKLFLNKLIDLNPVNLQYRINYSKVLYEVEGINSAVGYLYDILLDYPNNSKLLSAIGIYFYKSGQQKKYENIKEELLQLPKKDPSIYKFMIDSAKLDNEDKVLVENSLELLQLEPGNLKVRIELGKTYIKMEQYKKALAQFKIVESRLDSYPRLKYFMSKLYLLTDNNEKAIELAKEEVKLNPQNIEGYVLLGDVYQKQRKYIDAEDMYKKAQKINDNDIDTLLGLASINLKKSQFDIAVDLLKKARQLDPNKADTHKLLGDSYRKIGQSSLAIESYQIFLELSPNTRYKDEINTYIRTMK